MADQTADIEWAALYRAELSVNELTWATSRELRLAFDSLTYPITSNLLQITFLRTLLSSNVRGSGFIQAFAGCSRVLADILQMHDFTLGRRDHAQILAT